MSDRIPAPSVVMTGQSGAGDDGKMVKLWLESFRSPHTRRGYEADAKAFRDFVCKPLAEVTVVDVLRFGDSLDHLASATAARRLAAVKSLIKMAHDVGYLDFDVGRVVTLPVVKDTLNERIMSEADVQKLLAAETQPRNAALLRLVYSAGLRISEACGLLWRDLRGDEGGEGGEITVLGKGGKTRVVRLPGSVWKRLVALRGDAAPDGPVFLSRQGGALDPVQVHRIVKDAAMKAGLSGAVSTHWLRHAHVSHALNRGAPVHVVRATVGHASLATTTRYAHSEDSSARYLIA